MIRILKIISYLVSILIFTNIIIGLFIFPFEKKLRENFGFSSFAYKNKDVIGIDDKKEFKKFLYYNTAGNFYDYDEFVGWKEREINSQYFNVDKNGRLVEKRPSNCKTNIFIYGSSITFGYLSKDQNTIASFLQEILNKNNHKNFCVYNYGRANFHSYRENLLLKKHIVNKKLNKDDFAIFLDGSTELLPSSLISKIKKDLKYQSNDFYNNFFYAFLEFLKSTPFYRFYEIADSKLINNKKKFQVFDEKKVNNLVDMRIKNFLDNLKIRENLCSGYDLNCLTFIEPNGYARKELENKLVISDQVLFYGKYLKTFHEKIKMTEGTINISDSLNDSTEIIYIDDMHLTPYASNFVANKIYFNIKSNIN